MKTEKTTRELFKDVQRNWQSMSLFDEIPQATDFQLSAEGLILHKLQRYNAWLSEIFYLCQTLGTPIHKIPELYDIVPSRTITNFADELYFLEQLKKQLQHKK